VTTTWGYDGFGRRTLESRADGTQIKSSFVKCIDHCGEAVNVTITDVRSGTTSIAPPTEVFTDRLGRTVQKRTWVFSGAPILQSTRSMRTAT